MRAVVRVGVVICAHHVGMPRGPNRGFGSPLARINGDLSMTEQAQHG